MEIRNRKNGDSWQALLDITVTSLSDAPQTVYLVVYAKNDSMRPPRRSACRGRSAR